MRKRSRSELRHRFYRKLFLMALVLLMMMALPSYVFRVHLVGAGLLQVLLLAELGQVIPRVNTVNQAFKPRDVRNALLYRLLGIVGLVALLIWMFTPAHAVATGLPVLIALTMFVYWSLQRLLRLLAREAVVNRDVIGGAIAGYLLLGVCGGLLLTVVETLQPGSFQNLIHEARHVRATIVPSESLGRMIWDLDYSRINYFAFVSLTTVGYGDIVPVKPLAETVSVSLSMVGPMYLAMVMGLLISRFTVQAQQQRELLMEQQIERQVELQMELQMEQKESLAPRSPRQ